MTDKCVISKQWTLWRNDVVNCQSVIAHTTLSFSYRANHYVICKYHVFAGVVVWHSLGFVLCWRWSVSWAFCQEMTSACCFNNACVGIACRLRVDSIWYDIMLVCHWQCWCCILFLKLCLRELIVFSVFSLVNCWLVCLSLYGVGFCRHISARITVQRMVWRCSCWTLLSFSQCSVARLMLQMSVTWTICLLLLKGVCCDMCLCRPNLELSIYDILIFGLQTFS